MATRMAETAKQQQQQQRIEQQPKRRRESGDDVDVDVDDDDGRSAHFLHNNDNGDDALQHTTVRTSSFFRSRLPSPSASSRSRSSSSSDCSSICSRLSSSVISPPPPLPASSTAAPTTSSTTTTTTRTRTPQTMSHSTMHGIRQYNNAVAGRSHLNGMLLLEAERRRQIETYEEMKRLLVFAGIFFLFAIAFILMRFKISIDDVFKWSPVIWLLGVINCGLLMNLFVHVRKYLRARELRRDRQRRDLLLSLHLPNSFPCLAPPGTHCCHQHPYQQQQQQQLISRREMPLYGQIASDQNESGAFTSSCALPSYEQCGQFPLISPPAFVVHVYQQQPEQPRRQKLDGHDTPPPGYRESIAAPKTDGNEHEEEQQQRPT